MRWFRRYWRLPLFIAGVILVWLLFRRWKGGAQPPMESIQRELQAIRAGAEANRLRAKLGAEKALQIVEKKYQQALADLDERQKIQADRLRDDPEALTRFIIRGSG